MTKKQRKEKITKLYEILGRLYRQLLIQQKAYRIAYNNNIWYKGYTPKETEKATKPFQEAITEIRDETKRIIPQIEYQEALLDRKPYEI